MLMGALRDLDVLLVPVKRTFKMKGEVDMDLLADEKVMKAFLDFGATEELRAEFSAMSGQVWELVHDDIGEALNSVKITDVSKGREKIQSIGLAHVFSEAYANDAMPDDADMWELRDVESTEFEKRMRNYTATVIAQVKKLLALGTHDPPEGGWEKQILSKIRYLTSSRCGRSAKPFFCLQYLRDIEAQFAMTPTRSKR